MPHFLDPHMYDLANAELWVGSTDPKKKNLIAVSVVSGCFRAPEGTDLKGLY